MKTFFLFCIVLCSSLFAQLPNLIISSGGFSPSTISPGGLLTITAIVQNSGTGNSTKSHLSFYLSTTTKITNGICIGDVSVEPLASGATSELKQIYIPIPRALASGTYYLGWVIDPYNEVIKSSNNNIFYLPNSKLTITNSVTFSRHLPYPIIFIHGLSSNDQKWDTLFTRLDLYGLCYGGRMDFCLNYDGNVSKSILLNDIHDFTNQLTLNIGDCYTVNFDVNIDGTTYNNTCESNQAAIVKQGKAMQAAIRHVLDKTGSDKVILVGHSMGGLAAREYLQNSSNWQPDGQHHVAKLLTVGTPHGGSNTWTFGLGAIADGYSDAVRDLRWSYSNGYSGVYLFGGNENNLNSIGFYNLDVNCNGLIGDNIIGLNQKNIPSDLAYSCVIGIGSLLGTGDYVVDASRANLNNYYKISADTFLVNAIHTDLPKEIETNIAGLDEPTNFQQAYRLGLDTLYYGFITTQSLGNTITDDYDNYFINVPQKSSVNIKLSNITVSQLSISIYDQFYSRILIINSKILSQIDTTSLLTQGKYYLVVQATPDNRSWWFPYSIKVHSTPLTSVENNNLTRSIEEYHLEQNYPNPFNPETIIHYQVPENGKVSLKIFDLLGKEVVSLVNEEKSPGKYDVKFNGRNFPSGVYFYQLRSGQFIDTKKFILLK